MPTLAKSLWACTEYRKGDTPAEVRFREKLADGLEKIFLQGLALFFLESGFVKSGLFRSVSFHFVLFCSISFRAEQAYLPSAVIDSTPGSEKKSGT